MPVPQRAALDPLVHGIVIDGPEPEYDFSRPATADELREEAEARRRLAVMDREIASERRKAA